MWNIIFFIDFQTLILEEEKREMKKKEKKGIKKE